jgi:hypothetical protein
MGNLTCGKKRLHELSAFILGVGHEVADALLLVLLADE